LHSCKESAKPPEACRPQEGLKTKAPKNLEALGRAIRRAPQREAFIPDVKFWEVFQAGEGDDGARGRSNDLTKTTTEPKEGLAT
jgi:hypothetical protein